MIGPPDIPVRNLFLSVNFYSLYEIFSSSYSIYRAPDTPLRFLFFIFSIIFFIFSIFRKPYSKKQPILIKTIIPLMIFLFILTLLITNGLYNYFGMALVLLSFYYSLLYSENNLSGFEKLFLLSYLIMFLLPFWSSMIHPTSLAEIDNYVRFLLVIPVYLTLRDINIPFNKFINVVNISSLLIGVFSLYCLLVLGESRVRGFTSSAIIFGNISLLFSLFSYLSISSYTKKNIMFPIIASGASFFAWASTGSRGSVIFIFVFILLLFTKNFRETIKIPKNIILYTLLLFSSVILVNPSVIERFSNAYDSTYNYMIDGSPHHWKHSDSIVPRVNIWKGSMLMIEENFITGIGLNNFNESLGQKIKIGKIQPIRAASNNLTDGQNHAHNQFLDIFAKTGLFGFLSLIFFMMIHLYFFYRSYNLSHNNIETKYLSLFGVISVVGYIFYMSTNSILSHQLSTLFMILLFIILSGMITNRLEKP